jgi:hypothetical protein
LPIFDGGFTDAGGVRGKFGPFGSDAEIGLTEFPPNAEYVPAYARMRRETRHRAIVLVTRGTRVGLSPINASHFTEPYGPPILQVSSEVGDLVREQAEKKVDASVVVQVRHTKAQAFNVTAKVKGADSQLAPLVVMTPRSGWWRSASERGGGLACWLEVMRAVSAARPERDVIFLASSGHELGHLGLETFIDRQPRLVKGAHIWMHFGANIGAAQEGTNRIQASDDEVEHLAVEAMTVAGLQVNDRAVRGSVPNGEAHNIHQGGGRYISLLGRNALFHHPADRWPDAVDVAAVVRYVTAFSHVALKLILK